MVRTHLFIFHSKTVKKRMGDEKPLTLAEDPLWACQLSHSLGSPFSPSHTGLSTLPEALSVVGSVLSFLGVQLMICVCFLSIRFIFAKKEGTREIE